MARAFVAWLCSGDPAADDLAAGRHRICLPAAIVAFRRRDCRAVVHRGWEQVVKSCELGPGDEVASLN